MAIFYHSEEDSRKSYSYNEYISASDILFIKGLMVREEADSFIFQLIRRIHMQFEIEDVKQRTHKGLPYGVPYVLRVNQGKTFHRQMDGKLVERFVGTALKDHFPGYQIHDYTESGVFDFKYEHPFGYDIYFEVKWIDPDGMYAGSQAQADRCAKLIRNDVERGIKTLVLYIMVSYDCKTVHIVYPQKREDV